MGTWPVRHLPVSRNLHHGRNFIHCQTELLLCPHWYSIWGGAGRGSLTGTVLGVGLGRLIRKLSVVMEGKGWLMDVIMKYFLLLQSLLVGWFIWFDWWLWMFCFFVHRTGFYSVWHHSEVNTVCAVHHKDPVWWSGTLCLVCTATDGTLTSWSWFC